MILRTLFFLLINFGALALGGYFTGKGVPSEWYINLNKAPWTPPGWMFGFAWTTIMICFSVYLAQLWPVSENKKLLITLYIVQWILNVGWNPTFFYYHYVALALAIIILLTIVVGFFLLGYWAKMNFWSVLVLPYLFWLLIATSLNVYVLIKN